MIKLNNQTEQKHERGVKYYSKMNTNASPNTKIQKQGPIQNVK